MTTYIYTDSYGKEITEEQTNYSENFYKQMLVNGNKKIVERIENNEVTHIDYHLETGETIPSLLSAYSNKDVVFINSSIVNNYTVEDAHYYLNNVLISRSKSVFDINNNCICYQKWDIATNTPIILSTEKSYYDSNNELIYSFEYNEDGSCFIIADYPNSDEILASTIGQPDVNFSWTGFGYYQYANPLVP